MRLALDIPASWPITRRRGRGVAVIPPDDSDGDGGGDADLLLTWGDLELLPDEQRRWVQATLAADVPPTAKLDVRRDDTGATADGWPVRLVEVAIIGSDGALLERRLAAFYAFFEHGATAMYRGLSGERFDAHRDQAIAILSGARPDFSGAIAALSQLWDVAPDRKRRAPAPAPAPTPAPAPESEPGSIAQHLERRAAGAADDAELTAVLAEIDRAIEDESANIADLEIVRGRVYRALGRLDEALAAFERAGAAGASPGAALYAAAVIRAELGETEAAIEGWRRVADADPAEVDALYNIGNARYLAGDFEAALEAWREAASRSPDDFGVARKIIQAELALGRYDDAAASRERLLAIWRRSDDPAVKLAEEFVFDQFEVDGIKVHASETLRPRDPTHYAVLTFRAVGPWGARRGGEAPDIRVQVETSDYAKERGTPYVLGVVGPAGYKVIGTSASMPPYPELRETVEGLLREQLASL